MDVPHKDHFRIGCPQISAAPKPESKPVECFSAPLGVRRKG